MSPIKRPVGVLFNGDIEQIFKWCGANPTIAPTRLAELVPTFSLPAQGRKSSWHAYAKRLIDEFGENEDVLAALNANLNTYSWTGSIVPYLEQQLGLMDELLSHSKHKVAEWANNYGDYLKQEIERQKKRDQEDIIM